MNIQKMMKQAQQMQQKIGEVQADLEKREFEGKSGGDMVNATITGKGRMVRLNVDKSLVDPNDKEVMEDLIVAAFNDAKDKADATFADEMGKMASGLGLPAGMKMPF
jgi:DNA-binding YbaB/EbfC family protein